MLRAITDTTVIIDSNEYLLDEVPDGLLTEVELAQVRTIHQNALPGYTPWRELEPLVEYDDPDNSGWSPLA